ncbi:MAG: soluble lytic murein transglycosylase [Sphingomonadales bacterium]|jgi:soluble lytic murein transglycosylase|nr:soluble lytic murein transglycosylase [Sphingomonadales bacterium]
MQKKALALSLLGVSAMSVAAVAAGVKPMHVARILPAAVQSVVAPVQPPPQPRPAPVYSPVPAAVSADLARWNSLRQTDSLPFSSYASFLMSHRGWPGETAMRKTAEKADADGGAAYEVIGYFSAFPPLTPAGHARHAFALSASGRGNEALEAARKAWTGGVLPPTDEARILSQFGGRLGSADHDARMEALLGNGDTQSAARQLPLASAQRQALYATRLALQTRASDAAGRLAALGTVEGDAGLLMDKANWLRGTGQSLAARQLMAQPHRLARPPANAEKWFETMMTLAKGAANDNQWSTAYQIASQLDDAYPAGTDVSARSYGERDEYTNLAWLAGTAANKLGRFADAARMFDLYGRAARSSQTRTKGSYWAARAAFNAGQQAQSNSWLEQAAASPDQFYGQLALERLGRRVTPPSPVSAVPSAAQRSAFAARPLVQAARALGDMGRWSDQSLFVRAIAEQAETESDRVLAAQFGRSIGRQDLGVWVAREARNKGQSFYDPAGFPEVPLPSAYAHHWALAHGITRQESSFDRAAMSPVGARGLMQLMPGTARETAGKVGLPYDLGRLTSDPSYNVMLGSSYFDRLLGEWGGHAALAVASYNAGAGNVRKWVRENGDPRGGADIVSWIEAIPYSETRNYVQRVLENAVVYEAIRAQRGGGPANRLSFFLGKSGPG